MRDPLSFSLGLRYTGGKNRTKFVSFISMMSMIGLTLGVMVLIIVLSVMNGFDRELKQRILGVVPHASIAARNPIFDWEEKVKQLEEIPTISGAAPLIQVEGMLSHKGHNRPVLLAGVSPEHEPDVSIIPQHMLVGDLDKLSTSKYGIILGRNLASHLRAGVGDKVTLLIPEASITPAGMFPRMKRMNVVGIFEVGAEVDGLYAFGLLQDLQKITRVSAPSSIRLEFHDLFRARSEAIKSAKQVGGFYSVRDWSMTHGNLFQAVQMEKTMVGLLLFLIIAVAAFNIVSSQVMVVNDKTPDIAILRTMGASRGFILRTFIVQGSVVGVVGTLVGTMLGILGALNVDSIIAGVEALLGFSFLNTDVYFISFLPSELLWSDVALVVSVSFILSFSATLYPAFKASRTNPAEALRYD